MSLEEDEKEESFYHWIKLRCLMKYFVEFTVKTYKMGHISFQVLQMHESRSIEKHKTNYFLSRAISCISSMKEHLGEELEVDMDESRHSIENKNDDVEN